MSDIIVCKVPVSEHCPSGVVYVVPSPNVSMKRALQDIPKDTIFHWVESRDNIPQDRYFRNALTIDENTKTIGVDMEKARLVHIDKLRVTRNAQLSALDAEYMKALEMEDKAKQDEIKAKKQALRDMPLDPGFANPKTPEELKAFCPDCLK
jgi:hypothetical protein